MMMSKSRATCENKYYSQRARLLEVFTNNFASVDENA